MVKSVEDHLREMSGNVAKFHEQVFVGEMQSDFINYSINSPIEQIAYMAVRTLQAINCIESAEPEPIPGKIGEFYLPGLSIRPQKQIGKYRVDFLISMQPCSHRVQDRKLVVECDGQEWHERTEEQRRYEKKRDRFLISRGYKVFHYTGKEIMDEPYRVAAEILQEVCGHEIELS